MSNESGQVPIEPTPTAVATVPVTAPTAESVTTERAKTSLEVGDIAKLSPAQLDEITQAIHDQIPRDPKSGRPLLIPEKPVPVVEPEIVPETAPEVVPEPVTEPIAEAVATEVTPEPTVEVDPEPEPGKLPQHRTRATNSFDDMVLRRYKLAQTDGRPLTMEQCVAAEKAAQGIVSTEKAAPDVKTIDSAKAELDALWAKHAEAKVAFDAEAEARLTREIFEKNEEIREIKEDAKARAQAENHRFQSASEAARLKAIALYPDLATEGSKIALRKDAIFAQHKASNDPIMFRADYKLLLAQMAAAEEGIAPKTAVTTPTPTSKPVARSVQPAKPVAPIASATARTTPTSKVTNVASLITGLKGNQKALDEIQEQLSNSISR